MRSVKFLITFVSNKIACRKPNETSYALFTIDYFPKQKILKCVHWDLNPNDIKTTTDSNNVMMSKDVFVNSSSFMY